MTRATQQVDTQHGLRLDFRLIQNSRFFQHNSLYITATVLHSLFRRPRQMQLYCGPNCRMVVNLRFDEWCSVVTVVFLPEFSTLCSQPVVLRCSKLHVLAHCFIFGQLPTFQPSLVLGVRGPAQNRGRVGPQHGPVVTCL
jgi:hypothetical protein